MYLINSVVVKLLDLGPQGRWFGHGKICTAVGPLSKACHLLSLINCFLLLWIKVSVKWHVMYYAKSKAFINFAQKRRQVLWAWSHLRRTKRQWKRVLWSDESRFLKKTIQRKVQKPAFVMVWGCITAHGMGDLHICEGTIHAEAYVGILERHMLLSRRQLFPGTPCLFHEDNATPHSARVTTA